MAIKSKSDREGRSELHYAALDGDVVRVRTLLSRGADPSAKDETGLTPLHFAAQSCALEAASILIEHGAEVDAPDAHGNTPLSRAVFESRGRGEMIALLRGSGADPMRQNLHGVSPLSLARTIGNFDVAKFFGDLDDM